ncbi:MAG TPA: hypothetical protein VFS21_36085 [Roseiflexaceae bacterium]|nr:hypothetical protein [Roseiflexaceae bacterium]
MLASECINKMIDRNRFGKAQRVNALKIDLLEIFLDRGTAVSAEASLIIVERVR